MGSTWGAGDVVVRREVIGLDLDGRKDPAARVWFAYPVHVVHDSDDLLVSYVGTGAEFGFVDGRWPTATGEHPWRDRVRWEGHGCLMVQRPADPYAVWHYWHGPDRTFLCWYVNFQAPLWRTAAGYDTQDFELDIVVFPDGSWRVKDLELMPQRVADGYISSDVAERVVRAGEDLVAELATGQRRWDDQWATWTPPSSWRDATLPPNWNEHGSASRDERPRTQGGPGSSGRLDAGGR